MILTRTILAGERVAGHVSNFTIDGRRELTYWLGREFWGRRIRTRAVSHFLAVEPYRPPFARVATDNLGSRHVPTTAGYVASGSNRGFANARQATIDELSFIYSG